MQMNSTSRGDRRELAHALFCIAVFLILFLIFVALSHRILVHFLGLDMITWEVTVAAAVLVWIMEELLQTTIPLRRSVRRLAYWMAETWLNYRATRGR